MDHGNQKRDLLSYFGFLGCHGLEYKILQTREQILVLDCMGLDQRGNVCLHRKRGGNSCLDFHGTRIGDTWEMWISGKCLGILVPFRLTFICPSFQEIKMILIFTGFYTV